MEPIILDKMPVELDLSALMAKMRVAEDSAYATELREMVEAAQTMGKPKVIYKLAFINSRGDDWVDIDGTVFNSRVLRVNLAEAQRAFCFVATSGLELEEWSRSLDGLLQHYYADVINEMVLKVAIQFMTQHLVELYQLENMAMMNPGSLTDWPLKEQRKLFALLGDTENSIGVHLTNTLLMVPTKSVSGILFPTQESFASCQLCPKEGCPNRRAPYDKNLYERRYKLSAAAQ